MNAIQILKNILHSMKSRFCYFIHAGITGAKKMQRTKQNHFLFVCVVK